MLSKLNAKDEKGVSKVAIIVGIAIAIVILLIVIIALVISSANKSSQENNVDTNTLPEEIWDTNNEITIEEKNDLKENYLGIFSILASNKHQTEDENLIEAAIQLMKMKDPTSSIEDDEQSNTNQLDNTTTNNISNTPSFQQTMENDTIVITGDNPLNNNINTNTANTNTTNNNSTINNSGLPNMNMNNSGTNTNNSNLDEEEIKIAINELNGKSIDDLSSQLSRWNSSSAVVPGYVTDIISITKANGVYDIIYKVCWPTKSDLIKYGTMDKVNTSAVDILESTTINIKLVKNRTFDYSQYKVQSITEIEKEVPTCYYLSYSNNKCGVIDQSGNIILDNIYDWIDIPNNYKDIFICTLGTNTVVLDKDGQQRYTDYNNISVIRSTAGGESMWYEKDFLVFQQNGKFGAIDYDGFVIYEPIYDSIEPLYYIEGKIVLTESGKQALADITGKVISNFKYTQIGLLGGQFDLNSMVNSQRTLEQVQAMMQEGYHIVGRDANGTVERIQAVTLDEYNVDFSSLPKVNYPNELLGWSLRLLDGVYLVYYK